MKKKSKSNKRRFGGIEKSNLEEFNLAEIRGWVIDRLIQIEYVTNDIILEFFKPEQKQVFNDILLNSSVVDFGGKIKVLKNIGVSKITIEKLRKIVSIRNGFAHASFSEFVTVSVQKDKNGNEDIELEAWSTISVMNSQGDISKKAASDYLNEFYDLNKKLRVELDEFLESLRDKKKQSLNKG